MLIHYMPLSTAVKSPLSYVETLGVDTDFLHFSRSLHGQWTNSKVLDMAPTHRRTCRYLWLFNLHQYQILMPGYRNRRALTFSGLLHKVHSEGSNLWSVGYRPSALLKRLWCPSVYIALRLKDIATQAETVEGNVNMYIAWLHLWSE